MTGTIVVKELTYLGRKLIYSVECHLYWSVDVIVIVTAIYAGPSLFSFFSISEKMI